MSSIILSFISSTQIYVVNSELSHQVRFMSSIMLSFISSSRIYVVNYAVIYVINLELCRQLRIISSTQIYVINYIVTYLINSDLCHQFTEAYCDHFIYDVTSINISETWKNNVTSHNLKTFTL